MNDDHDPKHAGAPKDGDLPEPLLEALTRYVLGECSDQERAEMDARLEASAALRQERALMESALCAMREERSALDAGAEGLASERRAALVHAAGEMIDPAPRRSWLGFGGAIAAATVLGLGSIGWWAMKHESTPSAERSALGSSDGVDGFESLSSMEKSESDPSRTQSAAENKTDSSTDAPAPSEWKSTALPAPDSYASSLQGSIPESLHRVLKVTPQTATVVPSTPEIVLFESITDFGIAGETMPQQQGTESARMAGGRFEGLLAGEGGGGDLALGSAELDLTVLDTKLLSASSEAKASSGKADVLDLSVLPLDGFFYASNHAPNEASHDTRTDAPTTVDQILGRLARHSGEAPSAMFFRYWGDHDFEETALDAESTFALDVDTASYSLARNYLSRGVLPPKEAVRTEEFVNSFDYGLAPPAQLADGGTPTFAIHTELAPSPFGAAGQQLLFIGVKAREVSRADRPPVSLTFVIDTSGSMKAENRLDLVKQTLHLLVDQLEPHDTIGIVAFESTARRVLEPHSLEHRAVILAAIDSLAPGGSTNAAAGLELGYQMALGQFRDRAQNRVLLCSDGVANTGPTDVDTMLARVEKLREADVFLQCVGVGMGNHNDALLEQLADRGDGSCQYVDTLREAKRIFVEELTGSLLTVAADAKVQVHFDAERVVRYRLLGYENRAIADRDFRNDAVDAGEVGAGHEVVALYELELRESALDARKTDTPLAEVSLRYRDLARDQVVEQNRSVGERVECGSSRFQLAADVAEFAEILRRSVWAKNSSLGQLATRATALIQTFDQDPRVVEFVALVQQAAALPGLFPEPSALEELTDAMKRNRLLEARVRELESMQARAEHAAMLEEIEQQNARLEARLRELLAPNGGR